MRIKKESKKILKKFVLPEGVEIEAGKYILEQGDSIWFTVTEQGIENFGDKKAEPFDSKDAEDAREKKEEVEDEAEFNDDVYTKNTMDETCKKEEEVEIEIEDDDDEEMEDEEMEDEEMEDEEMAESKKAKNPNELLEASKKRYEEVTKGEKFHKKGSMFNELKGEQKKWK